MKKLFLSVLFAILLVGGYANLAHAIAIPEAEQGNEGPAVWLVPVYNNSGGTLDVGDVVVWDIEQSTGDNDNYVTTTTTADTVLVAGVVYGNDIAAASSGTIAVHGFVSVDMAGGGNTVDGPVCTSATAGSAQSCGNNAAAFGFVTTVTSSGSANVFVKGLN